MRVAFMAFSPGSDPSKHRSMISTDMMDFITVMVPDRNKAVAEAKKLADKGYNVIELCSGFGHSITAMVADAVKDKAMVGAVRFDFVPFLGGSGDKIF
jgi:hypothetical protein